MSGPSIPIRDREGKILSYAYGDGEHDDTAALRSALAQSPEVVLRRGVTYKVDGVLLVDRRFNRFELESRTGESA